MPIWSRTRPSSSYATWQYGELLTCGTHLIRHAERNSKICKLDSSEACLGLLMSSPVSQRSSAAITGRPRVSINRTWCVRRFALAAQPPSISREVRFALFQESRKCLFCILGAHLLAELLVLALHRDLDLLAERPLHQPLAGLQRASGLCCQLPGRFR